MSSQNTNRTQSVAGVVIRDSMVLLVRHTYGIGKGMLTVPGGYVNWDESPQDALKREFMEETRVLVEPKNIIGIRFNMHDWYIAFAAEYISGEAVSDHNENSEVLWVDVSQALTRNDVSELAKKIIRSDVSSPCGLQYADYSERQRYAPYSLYTAASSCPSKEAKI